MNQTLERIYQDEVQNLTDALQNFASQHPDVAGRMNLDPRGRDPHIELLVNGCAYLQARVKEQIDLGVHVVSESLLRHLAPQYLLPRPSQTIIEFTSIDNCLIQTECIPQGSRLVSKAVGDEYCSIEFTTDESLYIHPFCLTASNLQSRLSGHSILKLSFKFNEGVNLDATELGLIPLFINAQEKISKQWKYYLLSKVAEISLKDDLNNEYMLGGQELISTKKETFFSNHSEKRMDKLHRLGNYFHCREGFNFIVLNLSAISLPGECFTICIAFKEALPFNFACLDVFKLHCVPASNCFVTSCEPIRYNKNQHEYPLIVDQQKPASLHLLNIKKVEGVNQKTLDTIALNDFNKISTPARPQCQYRLAQVSDMSNLPAFKIIFSGNLPESMYISCDVLACNGEYPWVYLSKHDLSLCDDRVAVHIMGTNLMKPSRYSFIQMDSDYAAKGLALANAELSRLTDVSFLKQLLHLLDWKGVLFAEIESILTIRFKPLNQLKRGIISQRICGEITLDEQCFNSTADCYAFGEFLHGFLTLFAPINHPLDVKLQTLPSQDEYVWPGTEA